MDKINYKALLIGNTKFEADPHNLPELKGPINDIQAMEAVLTHPQVGLHKPDNVITLVDNTNYEIQTEIEEFFGDAKRDDQLLLYYSGHGRLDIQNHLYLCARNTNTKSLISTGIPDSQINGMIENSVSKRIVIILDCCHSGKFKGGGDYPETLDGEGRIILSSSRARELSEDSEDKDGMSPFTKFLVEALLSSESDSNKDNFISVNEVYEYVAEKLGEVSKQRPQRNFRELVGELAIGKSVGDPVLKEEVGVMQNEGVPKLAVSETNIEIRDVSPDEILPEEVIDVFNEGKGALNWKVECSDSWINITKGKGYFKMKLNPVPGVNRGRVYVRDERGGSKRIQVIVQMNEKKMKTVLKLSHTKINFGTVSQNSNPPTQQIRLENTGDGELNPKIKVDNDAFRARLVGDIVEVSLDASSSAQQNGTLYIESNGGNAKVAISAKIEKGPVLSVDPKEANFGKIKKGTYKKIDIHISNSGGGRLDWQFEKRAKFIAVNREGPSLSLTLIGDAGNHTGSIIIKSNGGDFTLPVKAKIKAPDQTTQSSLNAPVHQNTPAQPNVLDLNGIWASQTGRVQFSGAHPQYVFKELNILGAVVGEGTAVVNGNQVILNGYNIMAGQLSANLVYNGNTLSGNINAVGSTSYLILQRQQNQGNTGFNWMNLFS